jgi:hypothetical protein
LEGAFSHDGGKHFAAYIHQHDSTPFVGVAEIAFLWYGDALTFLPGFVICLTFKEFRNVFVEDLLVSIVHGFEGFWRNAIKTGRFPLFELGNGTFDFVEGDRGVNGG